MDLGNHELDPQVPIYHIALLTVADSTKFLLLSLPIIMTFEVANLNNCQTL
jgi:hypothetical protein